MLVTVKAVSLQRSQFNLVDPRPESVVALAGNDFITLADRNFGFALALPPSRVRLL